MIAGLPGQQLGRMHLQAVAWRVGPLVAALVAVVIGTALVPYLFPSGAAPVATSSVVGYNNSVAYVWYVATVLVAGVFLARLLPPPTRRLDVPLPPASAGLHWGAFAAVVIAHVLLFAAIYAYKGRFVFFDGVVWQTWVYRMSLGDIPLRDFSYYYGPSMLYPAHWLQGILSVEAAYGIWYVGTYVVGLFMLHFLLAKLLASKRAAALWFALLSVGLFSVAAGVNVTPFRYLLPAAIFVAVIDLLARGGWLRFVVVAASLSFAALYGFEIAVLSVAAVLIPVAIAIAKWPVRSVLDMLVGWRASAGETSPKDLSPQRLAVRSAAVLAIAAGITVASLLAIDRSGTVISAYAGASFAYLGGAHNQPMYPHAPFLVLASISVLASGASFRVMTVDRRGIDLAVVGGLLFLSLLTQRASFGTVDPSHISAWGLSTLLLVLWLTTRWRWGARLRRWLFVAVIAGFVLPLQIYQVSQLAPFFGLVPGNSPATTTGQPAARSATVEASLVEAVSAVGPGRPYLMYGFNYYSFPVYERFHLRYPQYATDLLAARDPKDIEQLIGEVRSSSAYVVIRKAEFDSDPTPPHVDPYWDFLTLVTGAPMPGSTPSALLSSAVAELHAPFIAFLRTEYTTVYERDGLLVLAPRG